MEEEEEEEAEDAVAVELKEEDAVVEDEVIEDGVVEDGVEDVEGGEAKHLLLEADKTAVILEETEPATLVEVVERSIVSAKSRRHTVGGQRRKISPRNTWSPPFVVSLTATINREYPVWPIARGNLPNCTAALMTTMFRKKTLTTYCRHEDP